MNVEEKLAAMDWINLSILPPPLSRFHSLLETQTPFAVIVTESTKLTKAYSILQTAHIIGEAQKQGLTCILLNLSYRPRDEQALRSDLGLLIYSKRKDPTMSPPAERQILRPFVIEALNLLDHKVALYANAKRTGRLDYAGRWNNSFRTATLTPAKFTAYLSYLVYEYLLIEVGTATGGIFARMAWDRTGMQPGLYYGSHPSIDFPTHFQFGDFPCI